MTTDRLYLIDAYWIARESPDPSTQNGALLIDDCAKGHEIGRGCNTFPDGVERTPERLERPLKYDVIEHAERNAIYYAAAWAHTTVDATLYCPWAACADCARAIIQVGIKRLVRHADATEHGRSDRWDGTISIADMMLHEAGVEITDVHGKIMPADFTIRHNGEEWSP